MPTDLKNLLFPPISRAAYSDRMSWIMAELSFFSYTSDTLTENLKNFDFELVKTFSKDETFAFIAKRGRSRIAVLAFRGTVISDWDNIKTDIDDKFYGVKNGVKIHSGFEKAFGLVKKNITHEWEILRKEGYSLYITGHSLGAALALIAARDLSSDDVAACYTFGCPRVANSEFGDKIKVPIYRVVNANDIVPRLPFSLWSWICILFLNKIPCLQTYFEENSYAHQGDDRYLTEDINRLRLIENPNFQDSLYRYTHVLEIKLGINNHSCEQYIAKLMKYAQQRVGHK